MSKTFRFKPNKRHANDGEESLQTNGEKADQAQRAVDAFAGNGELECDVQDLIAHLGHLCDRHHLDFIAQLESAQMHWELER